MTICEPSTVALVRDNWKPLCAGVVAGAWAVYNIGRRYPPTSRFGLACWRLAEWLTILDAETRPGRLRWPPPEPAREPSPPLPPEP